MVAKVFRAASAAKRLAGQGQALLPGAVAIALLGGAVVVPGAKALTVTYSSGTADYVPTPNSLINTRPLQLSWTGTAITNPRNFIYSGLAPSPLAGRWIPLNQAGPNPSPPPATANLGPGNQRFDYLFGNATSSSASPTSYTWVNGLDLQFGSFYLDGGCPFCGPSNAVSLVSVNSTGNGTYIGIDPNGASGNQNTLTSDLYAIVFGASGITGTLQFDAFTDVTDASGTTPVSQSSRGTITLNINYTYPPAPAPLPLAGLATAWALGRRLRCRIRSAAETNP
jgi:hypothetical protein